MSQRRVEACYGPTQDSESRSRKQIDPTVVTHIHVEMQGRLYDGLVAIHGESNVGAEHPTASGRPTDLIVKTPDGFELYEIKTAEEPRDCVRQAIGQLLEYAYWPGSRDVSGLFVVGMRPIDEPTDRYLTELRECFGIPLQYVRQTV